jgi:hypothetical protein
VRRVGYIVIGILPRETPATLHGCGEDLGRGVPITHPSYQLGVVNLRLKATSSELNRVSKKDIIKEGGRPRDVKTQTQVSKKVS